MSEMVYTSFYGIMNSIILYLFTALEITIPIFYTGKSISYQRKHNNSSVHNVLLGIFLIKGYEI